PPPDRLQHVRPRRLDRDVVEHGDRLGADADHVVHVHRDAVDPDRVVTAEHLGHQHFGADAVRGQGQAEAAAEGDAVGEVPDVQDRPADARLAPELQRGLDPLQQGGQAQLRVGRDPGLPVGGPAHSNPQAKTAVGVTSTTTESPSSMAASVGYWGYFAYRSWRARRKRGPRAWMVGVPATITPRRPSQASLYSSATTVTRGVARRLRILRASSPLPNQSRPPSTTAQTGTTWGRPPASAVATRTTRASARNSAWAFLSRMAGRSWRRPAASRGRRPPAVLGTATSSARAGPSG